MMSLMLSKFSRRGDKELQHGIFQNANLTLYDLVLHGNHPSSSSSYAGSLISTEGVVSHPGRSKVFFKMVFSSQYSKAEHQADAFTPTCASATIDATTEPPDFSSVGTSIAAAMADRSRH